jgi:hypothetical protein
MVLADFPAATADVELSGACHAIISVSDRLYIDAGGASTLSYYVDPGIGGGSNFSGGSSINSKD